MVVNDTVADVLSEETKGDAMVSDVVVVWPANGGEK